jgi:hypothetical protein
MTTALRVKKYKPHLIQFTQSPNYMRSTSGNPLHVGRVDRIVVHATVSPCVAGGAKTIADTDFAVRNTAQQFHGSAHLVADPSEVGQALAFYKQAEAAPPNSHSWHIELCDMQDETNPGRWQDPPHIEMLHRAARRVAQLCLFGNVPIQRIQAPNLDTERGICGHVDVSNQWHLTDHVDPGPNFPWQSFMTLVAEEAYRLKGSSLGLTP